MSVLALLLNHGHAYGSFPSVPIVRTLFAARTKKDNEHDMHDYTGGISDCQSFSEHVMIPA